MPIRKPTADTTRAIDAFRAVLLHGPTSWPGAITSPTVPGFDRQ